MNRKIIKQQYVIFGCGGFLERKLEEIEQVIDIVCICDNNKNMWGKKWRDKYECVSPDELINYIQYEVLISVEKEAVYREIEGQLCKNNFKCKHLNEVLSKAWIDNNMPIIDEELSEVIKTNIPRIFLLGAPAHSNLGDQAQTYCIQNLVEGVYPERRFFVFEGNPLRKDYYYLLYIIKNIIRPDDKILVHSGYHCTDLFQKEEDLNEKIVQLFLDKKLIFFPQTIFFKGKEALEKSKKIYNSHSDLTIMCRDIVSYGLAKEYYDKCNLVLFPDVVTSLIGKRKYTEDRRGILLCLRGLEYEESNITSEEK